MRIISGTHKGRRFQAPKNLPVRPTTDMAKEALFNILNNQFYFDEISVLDLFAGIGNISFEFASRGTKNILCVEREYNCIKFIEKTADQFNMPIRALKIDAYKFLQNCDQQFTIVFADPPYDFDDTSFKEIHDLVFQNKLLDSKGLLIIEHSKHTDLSSLKNFDFSRSYGGNQFSFFKN